MPRMLYNSETPGWDDPEAYDYDDDNDVYDDDDEESYYHDDEEESHIEFASPGSALRAASATNPRNLPCPTCKEPNRLTPKDVALGYQCDSCADQAERGY
jgi:hypothetical protein